MSFFVTSDGPGKGADLGGLAGADKHCQELAQSVGAGAKTWHAYLSTQGAGAVNARDRIGKGPWTNAKGVVVATSVDDLHSDNNKLNKQNDLSEKGEVINGSGDKPNRHDVLTGSQRGRHRLPGRQGHDLQELDEQHARQRHARPYRPQRACAKMMRSHSWNSSHPSRGRRRRLLARPTCARPAATGCCTASR